MKINIMIPALVALMLFLTGCRVFNWGDREVPIDLTKPVVTVSLEEQSRKLEASREAIGENLEEIDSTAVGVNQEATSGEIKAPSMREWAAIKKGVEKIRDESKQARSHTNEIMPVEQSLKKADIEVEALDKYTAESAGEINKLTKSLEAREAVIKEYEAGTLQKQKNIWVGVTALSALGIIVGVAMSIWASPKLGIPLIVACSVLTCVSYFMVKYALLVAIIGGILLLIALIVSIYMIATNKTALVETALGFQLIKRKNWDDPEVRNSIKQTQSNTTRKIINRIKVDRQI